VCAGRRYIMHYNKHYTCMNSPEVEVCDESVENCEKGVAANIRARKGTSMKGRERYSLQQECANRI
jgi:hypothetical protein